MRKLVLILVASIAVITFIRALDYSEGNYSNGMNVEESHIAETGPRVVQ